MHYNHEVGYQEETCEQKIATLKGLGDWGTKCLDPNDLSREIEFGKGVNIQKVICKYNDIEFRENRNNPNDTFWEPVDYNAWKLETGVDFTRDCQHCKGDTDGEIQRPCLKECKYGEWTSWISFGISKDDSQTKTRNKTCVKNGVQAFGKSFYDYLKEDGNQTTIHIDLSANGTYYDASSFCSDSVNGEYGFKVEINF